MPETEHRFDRVEEDRLVADHFVVAVYSVDRVYGGPEEGGWWYTEGVLDRLAGAYGSEDAAIEAASDLRSDLELTMDRHSFAVDIVQIPRYELVPGLADQVCHLDFDPVREDYVLRFDIPTSWPEARPHYC